MARRKEIDIVVVTCYGRSWELERAEALDLFLDGIMNSEGSERDRYVNIYYQLARGAKEASDEI